MSTALILVLTAATAPAPAQEVLPGITWRPAEGCPAAMQVRRHIEELRTLPLPHGVTADAAVVVEDSGDMRMTVRLHSAGTASTRTLRATHCATLADAFALLVVVAAGRAASPPRGAQYSDTLARLTGELGIAGHVEWGASPSITGGPALSGSLLGRRWRTDLELAYAAPRELPLAITLQRYEATARAGLMLRQRWGDVSFTLGFTGGGFIATSRGGAGLASRHAPWVASQAAGRLAVRVTPRVFLTVGAAASVALTRLHFRHPVFGPRVASTGATNVRGMLGVAFRIPGRRHDGHAR